jgi:hypothetical protein
MEPHSLLFGHLLILKRLNQGLPKDAHFTYGNRKFAMDWKKYFPEETQCPGLLYLDLWPVLAEPLILVIDPEASCQLTQDSLQPRHPVFRWALEPVTGGKDLISMSSIDMQIWRLWRNRFNPGFSSRSVISNMPALLEETATFAGILKDHSGHDGDWGDVFTLYDRAVNLSFDVIARVAL